MSQFKYTLPSGALFTMNATEVITQEQADYIFYSQVASGALVGFVPGQSITSTQATVVKFALSRLDRGTAGVDDQVILSIVNGLPAVSGIPNLINVPLDSPITQADFANINDNNTFAPTSIGPLSPDQVQGLMAQISNFINTQRINLGIVDLNQPDARQLLINQTNVDPITGIGIYGLFCEQLEQAGYVKPATYLQFIATNPNDFVSTMYSPGIWTGLNGIYGLNEFLNSLHDQNTAQLTLMENGYESLIATGTITPPVSQTINSSRGYIYTESGLQTISPVGASFAISIRSGIDSVLAGTPLSSLVSTSLTDARSLATGAIEVASTNAIAAVTSNLTNTITGSVGALVANASKFGTNAVNAWVKDAGLGNLNNLTNLNLGSISGTLNNIPTSLNSLTNNIQNLNVLGKASQFATSFANPTASLTALGTNLSNQLQGQATALVGQLQGQATALVGQLQGQATALVGQLQGQATALAGQATALAGQLQGTFGNLSNLGSLGGLFGGGGDSLVSATKVAAGFSNTVNRAAVNAAVTRLIGSTKVAIPKFGSTINSASADIAAAQNFIKGITTQGQAIAARVTGTVSQVQGLASQAQNTINRLV